MKKILRILLPILLGGAILWWMYRGFQWEQVVSALTSDMRWGWMLLSMPFGILAQVFRGLRWRQMLEPMGERPRRISCVNHLPFLWQQPGGAACGRTVALRLSQSI